jgi:Arc/MetJ-type ribon-helix-helix transcriptional regulator
MAPLADPFSIRLSEAHLQFLDELCERRSYISRPTAIRALIEEAKDREARRARRQQPTHAA